MVWLQKLFTKTENNNLSDKVDGRDWVKLDPAIFGRCKLFFSTTEQIDLYELEELCDSVGWARRPLRKVKKALEHSYLVASVWEMKGTKPYLVGFARATSDQSFNATIWDVVIHPRFQGKGLGKAFMRYMINKLRKDDISNVTLFADPQVVEFYRSLGFVPDPEGIKGMFWYPD